MPQGMAKGVSTRQHYPFFGFHCKSSLQMNRNSAKSLAAPPPPPPRLHPLLLCHQCFYSLLILASLCTHNPSFLKETWAWGRTIVALKKAFNSYQQGYL